MENVDGLRQPFERPDLWIVARKNPAGAEQIDELLRQKRQQPIHPCESVWHHEVVAVSVDDQRRQQVASPCTSRYGRRVEAQRLAIPQRRFQPAAEERLVRRLVTMRQHPDRDLRSIAEQRVSEPPADVDRAPAPDRPPAASTSTTSAR
jgi:hypothetical protein